jgi:hypothetical protein
MVLGESLPLSPDLFALHVESGDTLIGFCRDAWAGGFTAGLVLGKTLHECIEMGHWLAGLGVQELGAM